ncbi:protein FAM166B [Betta splendens]|uniref:Ciliary microtubule inner protein 2B n=1 Tax=Betta splendens TaxID=158456 RepID=A0A6P7NY33_BETSP|nr:protein FAM166B [Betta splendens]XP_029024872.1 protein FAM166B [Betta splendens]
METYAPKMSRVLMTPDPHYIPGYAGYCPQLKFNMGRSYGQLTAQLLTSPEVKHSSRRVLHAGHVPSEPGADRTPRSPVSDTTKTIPGYTGFIPKSRNYFACSYSETCRRALTEFYQDRRVKLWQPSTCQDLPAAVDLTKPPSEGPKPPLTPQSDAVFCYKPLKSFTPVGNPYLMEDDDDSHKYFISGFTGHVPKSRFLFGQGYPVTTNQALVQFRKQQQQQREAGSHRPSGSTGGGASLPTIYPSNRGVVPSFTGHIPGYRFMYGRTFGQLSQNALGKSGIKRVLQEEA